MKFFKKKRIYFKSIPQVYTKFRAEYGSSTLKLAYVGDTVEELHEAIDNDRRLDNNEFVRAVLKYGYFHEFKDGDYITKDYVIDNCMHFMWVVRSEDMFI